MSQHTPTRRYQMLVVILSPLLALYTAWRTLKDGGTRYFLQRFGFGYSHSIGNAAASPPTLWIHAASVGEVFTVLPLIQRIKQPLLVTTMSPTGAAVLQQQQLSHVKHVYLPLDFPGACRRFFKKMNIHEGWIVETEIWPWLYSSAYSQSVPLTIINARLSERTSSQSKGLLASTYARALEDVSILARTAQDATGFANLGATTTSISVVGDLKYAKPDTQPTQSAHEPLSTRPYVLAASTHDNEELQLAQQWDQQLATINPDTLLVIVPRHPERGAAIIKALSEAGINAALRSQKSSIPENCQVYIADTLGELQAWYSQAIACFVGGSLIARGGHNMLEPARANCPIVVGTHTFNFHEIMDSLIDRQAIVIAKDAREVVSFFNEALNDTEAYTAMAQRASEQARRFENIVDAYLEKLQPDY